MSGKTRVTLLLYGIRAVRLFNGSKPFDKAFMSCPDGSHLAIVNDRPLFERLKEEFQQYFADEIGPWVGLRQTSDSYECEPDLCWQWQLPNGKHWPADKDKTMWNYDEPNNIRERPEHCAAMFFDPRYRHSGLNDQPCEAESLYICEKEFELGCPSVFHEASDQPITLSFTARAPLCYYVIKAQQSNSSIQLTFHTKIIAGNPPEILMYEGANNHTTENMKIAEWTEEWNNEYTITSQSDSVIIVDKKILQDGNSELIITFKQAQRAPCHCNETVWLDPGESRYIDTFAFANQTLFCGALDCEWTIETENDYHIKFHHLVLEWWRYGGQLVEKLGNEERRIPFHLIRFDTFTSNSSNTSLIFNTGFQTKINEYGRNIGVRSIRKSTDCLCPTFSAMEEDEGVLNLWTNDMECSLDCIYVIRAPRLGMKHGLEINYTYASSSDSFHHQHGQLSLTEGDFTSINYPRVYYLPSTKESVQKHQTFHTENGSFILIYHKEDDTDYDEPAQLIEGFSLSYKWLKMCECPVVNDGAILQAQFYEQTLTSPDYPHPYCTNLRCQWKIVAENNEAIVIKFEQLSLYVPDYEAVGYDSVGIRGKFLRKNANYNYDFIMFSQGSPHEHSLTVKSPIITFQSHIGNEKNHGFKLTYRKAFDKVNQISSPTAAADNFTEITSRTEKVKDSSSLLPCIIIAGVCVAIFAVAAMFLWRKAHRRSSVVRYNDGKQSLGSISYNQLQDNNTCLINEDIL